MQTNKAIGLAAGFAAVATGFSLFLTLYSNNFPSLFVLYQKLVLSSNSFLFKSKNRKKMEQVNLTKLLKIQSSLVKRIEKLFVKKFNWNLKGDSSL
jgi:hypothetical protein